ncbi:MAG: protein translocase subunit SecF [Oscillospiraceae bacterium]
MFEKAAKKFSFVGHFKLFGIISIILFAIGFVSVILTLFGVPAFNLDLDFVGGVSMEMELGTEVTRQVQESIEDIYQEVAGVTANVSTSGNSGTAVIVKTVEIPSAQREEIFNKVAELYGKDKTVLLNSGFVSANVGNDLKRSAFLASILAAILILVYITIRFELRSGLAAIICLLHDVMVMLSFFVIFRIPMNMTFIAAALTIIGYSINATIVVFDRVRENYKRQGGTGDFVEVVDRSIWQTMRRSIGTTLTTLMPVVLIIILGVTSIRIFALPLMVGILAGGYSSTCLAGPIWCKLKTIGKGGK